MHKNTQAKRRRHEVTKVLLREIKELSKDFVGFSLVTWDEKGNAISSFNRGNLPLSSLPSFVETMLTRSIVAIDTGVSVPLNHDDGDDDAS